MTMMQESFILKKMKQLICRLSDLVGILPSYYNYKGERIDISLETKTGLISSMGFRLDKEILIKWINYFDSYPWKNSVEPVYVIEPGSTIHIYLKENQHVDYIEIVPFKDSGNESEPMFLHLNSEALHKDECRIFENGTYFKYNVSIPLLSIGYYKMCLFSKEFNKESLLIVVPENCFIPFQNKTWGLHCNLWSLRGDKREGDFSHLKYISKYVDGKGGFISINPLHLNDPNDLYGISPYSSISRQFKTPLYISRCPVREKDEKFFNYSNVWQDKMRALRTEFELFYKNYINEPQKVNNFIDYKNKLHPLIREDLKSFSIFCFLREELGKNWQNWEQKFRKPEKESIDRIYQENEKEVLFYQYLQWLIDEEIDSFKQYNLCMDIAFGSIKSSFDVWINQEIYALSSEHGAPPDDFNPNGQKWGFPPVIPFKLKDQAYIPFIKLLKCNMNSSLLRIDHALGLFRAFWIPEDSNPEQGAYVKYPWKDLLGIIALESQLNRTGVIGEDLGTAEEWMKNELIKRKICSWKVFYFEKDGSAYKSSHLYPVDALCSITTHDLPTLRGFWNARDIKLRKQFSIFNESQVEEALSERQRDKEKIINLLNNEGLIKELQNLPDNSKSEMEELLFAIIKFLANTQSRYFLMYPEDLLFMEEQANFPGTIMEYPNWQRKLPVTVDEIIKLPILKEVEAILKEAGRFHSLD